MKFSYTVGGTQGQTDGSNAVTIIDTDSVDWKDRVRWIREQLGGIAEPVVRAMFQINPGADGVTPVGVHVGFVDWTHRDRVETVSAQSVHRNPEYVVDWLNRMFMLGKTGIENLRYNPPAPPPVVEDWKTPGSPLGEPWEMNGKMLWKALSQVENATWTGPSGTVYVCKRQPGLFAYYAFEVRQ